MRWIVTLLAIAGLWLGVATPELMAGWKDSVKRFMARPAADWPLYLFRLNGIIVGGLLVVELVKAVVPAGPPPLPDTIEPPVESDGTATEMGNEAVREQLEADGQPEAEPGLFRPATGKRVSPSLRGQFQTDELDQ